MKQLKELLGIKWQTESGKTIRLWYILAGEQVALIWLIADKFL